MASPNFPIPLKYNFPSLMRLVILYFMLEISEVKLQFAFLWHVNIEQSLYKLQQAGSLGHKGQGVEDNLF